MNIILGHTNMDMDCIASIALAKKLFPDYRAIKGKLIHPAAKNICNMMNKHLNFIHLEDALNESIENVIIVDTRSYQRVREFSSLLEKATGTITVFDHHTTDTDDIPGAIINYMECGANATNLCSILIDKKITLTPDEATIALSGIYADTGSFTHDNTTDADFACASHLVLQGASLPLVKNFLKSMKEEHQIGIFHQLLTTLNYKNINGNDIILSYTELEEQIQGLAAVVENIFNVENQDAYIAVFYFPQKNETLMIGRSQQETVNLEKVFSHFNGGGHKMAASATIKKSCGEDIYNKLFTILEENIMAAKTVADFMSYNVKTIKENFKLMEASIFLEGINCTGAPVVDDNEKLIGFLTLRDIMKGRKASQMHSPVKAYMSRRVVSVERTTNMNGILKKMYKENIGHLLVLNKGELEGIITRTDIVRAFSTPSEVQN